MKIRSIFLFFIFFNFTLAEQIIFRTTVSPGRVFISSKGGDATLTIQNISSDNLEILVGTENSEENHIKFFPKKFTLPSHKSQIVRLQVHEGFFHLKEDEKIFYITEYAPLVIIENKKFRPRHGITIKEKIEK